MRLQENANDDAATVFARPGKSATTRSSAPDITSSVNGRSTGVRHGPAALGGMARHQPASRITACTMRPATSPLDGSKV